MSQKLKQSLYASTLHRTKIGQKRKKLALIKRINSSFSFFMRPFSIYQVAWLKEESKTILSIDTNIITTNYRIFLIPDEEERKWVLHIKDVQDSDRVSWPSLNASSLPNYFDSRSRSSAFLERLLN